MIHLLGDYYFQNGDLAGRKNQSAAKLAEHGLIYLIISVICIVPIFDIGILVAAVILSLSHIAIDILKCIYIRRLIATEEYPPARERSIYLADQFLHIVFILIISFIITANEIEISLLPAVADVSEIIEVPYISVISWGVIILLVWKPANVTIKQLLCLNRPKEEEGKKAGGFIGLLERLIILLFLSIGQYSAIGLVLTAKSIARYDEISKNKDFAEYYLLGTLLSTFIVIAAYFLVF